ncbi:MAG: S8 family serine peptidase, partial [Rhodospirillaceae bacterium]
GDFSPFSRTASWTSEWPVKPDIVHEGGNLAMGRTSPADLHGALSLLSTSKSLYGNKFAYTEATSAATALAAKGITELWSAYPDLWPETVRGLYVSSARWTEQMKRSLPGPMGRRKRDYALLFQRYGYGIPDLERARRSASNALTLIIEDEITPYRLSDHGKQGIHNEMKLFGLPWPSEELRKLGNTEVTLRVTLSSFVAPNPSEASRGSRYMYASHNLRFKLIRANENERQFMARINKLAEQVETPADSENEIWEFGTNRRDVGSLHIDQLTCKASDLARRGVIAVHPVSGWWKAKHRLQGDLPKARFALIVEIDASSVETDLYQEVQANIATMIANETEVLV